MLIKKTPNRKDDALHFRLVQRDFCLLCDKNFQERFQVEAVPNRGTLGILQH